MKTSRYLPLKNDPFVMKCTKCERYDISRVPTHFDSSTKYNRCIRCNAIVKVPKKRRVTKHGIIAVQGQFGDGIYLYMAHNKKFIGHSIHHGRMSSKELADHIETFVEFRKKFAHHGKAPHCNNNQR